MNITLLSPGTLSYIRSAPIPSHRNGLAADSSDCSGPRCLRNRIEHRQRHYQRRRPRDDEREGPQMVPYLGPALRGLRDPGASAVGDRLGDKPVARGNRCAARDVFKRSGRSGCDRRVRPDPHDLRGNVSCPPLLPLALCRGEELLPPDRGVLLPTGRLVLCNRFDPACRHCLVCPSDQHHDGLCGRARLHHLLHRSWVQAERRDAGSPVEGSGDLRYLEARLP